MTKLIRLLIAASTGLALAAIFIPRTFAADTAPSGTQRNVAGIVAHSGGRTVQVGTAFFVAVPSQAFPGRSFVYLVSPRHNLLDDSSNPRPGLALTVQDSKTG